MQTHRAQRYTARLSLIAAGAALVVSSEALREADFSGVWGMVQHDRLGAPFFMPSRLPELSF
jgi:hypothetical protein